MAIITVGIPTYNRSAYLREAMEFVLGQSFGDFKLRLSHNGSAVFHSAKHHEPSV
ncbi:MAG: glycosyltransferase [Verrucomicrobia bacterium]|nr:glycosyltransferase [Verrucomicrobiota bacterium]